MRQQAEPQDHPTGAVVLLVASVLLFAGLDVLYTVLGSRTSGPAGPWAGLALRWSSTLRYWRSCALRSSSRGSRSPVRSRCT